MFVIIRFIIALCLFENLIYATDDVIELKDLTHRSSSHNGEEDETSLKRIVPLEAINEEEDIIEPVSLPPIVSSSKFSTQYLEGIGEDAPLKTVLVSTEGEELIDLENILSSSTFQNGAIIIWLDTEVVNKKDSLSKGTNKGLFIFGSLSAVARGSVYFILGYKLSEHYLVTSLNAPGNHIISTIYASASSVPMTLLGAASSQKFMKYLITPTPQSFIDIKKAESGFEKTLRISKNTFLAGASACSASILTYIAYDNFYPLVGWGWLIPGLPTFYVRTLIDYYAMEQLGSAAYEKFISGPKNKKLYELEPESRGANIHEIRTLLDKSRKFVSALNFKQAKILEDIINNAGEDVTKKINAFTNPELFIRDEVHIKETSRFRDVVGYIGGAVAVCGMYLYYNGTKAAFGFTQPLFNLTPEQTDYTTAAFAIFSLATASSLSAIAAHSSFQKFYDVASIGLTKTYKKFSSFFFGSEDEPSSVSPPPMSKEDRDLMIKRTGVASLAFLLACCDAGTLYELAVQQSLSMNDFGNVLALVSSSVSLFTMSFWAVDEALMYYVRGGDPKATILSLIDKVDNTLSSMSDSALKALKDLLKQNHGLALEEI
ncbi:MAG: hypothetical protein J0H12_07415 [Candidatus Paracaedimonas acanthamoebae]|uniref:Uncharacterized protein n=1 Tax=Candidatus Paracaedimonas acanthamoebae TaxID=244581 RepID=A0A8J7PSC7_9PROT|nr:hypothetical protein [Candidatus Paracaedimonas acanthamoebae]